MKLWLKWTSVFLILSTLIIIPFILYGEVIERWVIAFLDRTRNEPLKASLVLGGLLAGDVLLPTPSTVINTGCGLLLGFPLGAFVAALGMQVSCAIGYLLGTCAARPLVERWVGDSNAKKLHDLMTHYGYWMLVITRPVPVLAEASTLFAGMSRMSVWRFATLTLFPNIGIAAIYAWVGSAKRGMQGMLLAFAAAMLLPALALGLHKRFAGHRS